MIRWPIQFQNEKLGLTLIVDEDSRACYAYLQQNGKMVADVWLYNSTPAVATPEWTLPDARSRMPFLNPSTFGRQDAPTMSNPQQLGCKWLDNDGEKQIGAELFIDSKLWARLRVGDRPGESVHAIKDGPLAKRLVDASAGGTK